MNNTIKLSNKQKIDLLKKSDWIRILKPKEVFNLCWWEILKPKKLNKFYDSLNNGKSVLFAYKDAKNTK
jgi:hypothetical protein